MSNYEKNIEALKKQNQSIAEWIEKAEPLDWIKEHRGYDTKENMMVYSYHSSKPMQAYDIHDIYKDINPLLEPKDFVKGNCTVIIGFGLGHLLDKINEKIENGHFLVVVEPNAYLIKRSFEIYDFSEIIQKNALVIVFDKFYLNSTLQQLDDSVVIDQYDIIIEPYTRNRHWDYSEISLQAIDCINRLRCNTGTVESSGIKMADNDIACLPYLVRHRGINELVDLYANKPAVCIGTGPSLEKNIHLLKEYQDKVIIIAVGQAIRPLLAYDIKPDFALTVDFGEVNMAHYQDLLQDTEDIPLVTINRTYAPLIAQWQGPKFVSCGPVAEEHKDTVHGIMADKGFTFQGGSVSHFCFGLALTMGCNPIMFIGQDLALTERSHCSMADASGNVEINEQTKEISWKIDDSKCHLKDQSLSMGALQEIPGYYGEMVKTNIGLLSFLTSFEDFLETFNDTDGIINATEGGAYIEGANHTVLKIALEKHCKEVIDKSIIKPLLTEADNANELYNKALNLITEDIQNLSKLLALTEQAISSNEDLVTYKVKNPDHLMIKKNYNLTIDVFNRCKNHPLIWLAIYGANRQIHAPDQYVKFTDNPELCINRNKKILTAVKDATTQLLKTTKQAKKDLKNLDKIKPLQMTDTEIILERVEESFQNKNFAYPLCIARSLLKTIKDPSLQKKLHTIESKALELRSKAIETAEEYQQSAQERQNLLDFNEYTKRAQKLGRKGKFNDALQYLLKAKELIPDRPALLWGLASCYHQTSNYKKAIETYNEIIKNHPNYDHIFDCTFELGKSLVCNKQLEEGIAAIEQVMQATDKFDHFLPVLARVYYDAGDIDRSIQVCQMHLDKTKGDIKTWKYLLSLYDQKGDLAKSEKVNKIINTLEGKSEKVVPFTSGK